MARNIMQLTADGDTPETIRSALDALDELKPTSSAWAAKISAFRADLLQELQTIEGRLL